MDGMKEGGGGGDDREMGKEMEGGGLRERSGRSEVERE